VNKADRPGAHQTVKSLELMLHMGPLGGTRHHGRVLTPTLQDSPVDPLAWQIPVLETIATENQGIIPLVDTVRAHYDHLHRTGQWQTREASRTEREVAGLLQERFMAQFAQNVPPAVWSGMISQVVQRQMDPYTAVAHLFQYQQ
jgi:LAO/AO transport system kinase